MALFTLTPNGIEYIEDNLDCAILIVYHRKQVGEKMWALFGHYLQSIVGGEEDEEGGICFDMIELM
jgi:hypothetical protein